MKKKVGNSNGLVKGSLIYSIGNIGTLLLNFFLVPLYTFYLTRDELGYFDIFSSSLVFAAPLFFAHIELSVLRWIISDKKKKNIVLVLSHALFVFFAGFLLFTIIYGIAYLFFKWELAIYVYIYFLANFVYIIGKQIIRAVYSPGHYVATELLFTATVLGAILIFVKSDGLSAIFSAYGYASLVLLVYMILLGIHKKIDLSLFKISYLKNLLAYSLPLIPNTFNLWLNNMSNKYLIVAQLGLAPNGIYAIAFKFAYVLQILNRIFYFSFQDEMFKIYGEQGFKDFFASSVKKYLKILFSLLFMLVGIQRIVLPYVIDSAFFEAMDYIPILGLGVLFMALASIFGIVYQCEKKNVHASKTSLVPGLFIVLTGFFVIPELGLMGASIVFATGNLIFLIYRYIDTKKYISCKISPIVLGGYIAILFIIWQISEQPGFFYIILSFAMAVIFSLSLNWHLFKVNSAYIFKKKRT